MLGRCSESAKIIARQKGHLGHVGEGIWFLRGGVGLGICQSWAPVQVRCGGVNNKRGSIICYVRGVSSVGVLAVV